MAKPYPFKVCHCPPQCGQHIHYGVCHHPVDIIKLLKDERGATITEIDGWEVETCQYVLTNDNLYSIDVNLVLENKDTRDYSWMPVKELTSGYVQAYDDMCQIMERDGQKHKSTLGWTARFRDPYGKMFFMPCWDGAPNFDHKILIHHDHLNLSDRFNLPSAMVARTDSSIHTYYPKLLDWRLFTAYMGELVLRAATRKPIVTDQKWIAGSLLRARPVLRISRKYDIPNDVITAAPVVMDPWDEGASMASAVSEWTKSNVTIDWDTI
jgi:hypothetical protein